MWNISYEDVLRIDEMPDETYLSGYADDILVVITARDTESAQNKLSIIMRRVSIWMENHGLDLAMEKTELVVVTRKHIPTIIPMQVGTEEILTKQALKHLGVMIEPKLIPFATKLSEQQTRRPVSRQR